MDINNTNPITDNEEFAEFQNKIIISRICNQPEPLHGRLIRVSKLFLTIERKDGSIVSVAKSAIMDIRLIKHQGGV
ncbi:MAG: hypothetical protein NTX42_01260 [Methanothrix sp.]|nr:hypothetical protein [Methanothrix sp.]